MTGKATHKYNHEQKVWDYFTANPGAKPADLRKATKLTYWESVGAIRRLCRKRLLEGTGHTWERTYVAKGDRPKDARGWALNSRRAAYTNPHGNKRTEPNLHALDMYWGWASKSSCALTDQVEEMCDPARGTVRPEESEAA